MLTWCFWCNKSRIYQELLLLAQISSMLHPHTEQIISVFARQEYLHRVRKWKPCWRSNVRMGLRHHTTLTSSSGRWTSRLEVVFAQRHHRPSYAVIDCQRPSFSGRCCSCLERTTTPRHDCTVPASFLQSSRPIFFSHPLPSLYSACEVTRVVIGLSDTVIAFVTYLLTYLLKLLWFSTLQEREQKMREQGGDGNSFW